MKKLNFPEVLFAIIGALITGVIGDKVKAICDKRKLHPIISAVVTFSIVYSTSMGLGFISGFLAEKLNGMDDEFDVMTDTKTE